MHAHLPAYLNTYICMCMHGYVKTCIHTGTETEREHTNNERFKLSQAVERIPPRLSSLFRTSHESIKLGTSTRSTRIDSLGCRESVPVVGWFKQQLLFIPCDKLRTSD